MSRTLGLIALLAAVGAATGAERVETIDARALTGQVVSIDAGALVLRAGSKNTSLPRDQITDVTFERAEDLAAKIGQAALTTHTGDMLAAASLRLADGHFSLSNSLLGTTRVAMGDVMAVYTPGTNETVRDVRRQCEKLKIVATSQDTLVVAKEGKLLPVRGVLKGIARPRGSSETKVSFRWQDTDRTISIKSVRAIILAKSPARQVALAATLTARDGTRVALTSLTLAGNTFKVTTAAAGAKTLARKNVASIRFAGTGATDLASLKPSSVTEHGFFDHTFPHRINTAVSGRPLRLGGRTYSTGLGLHSFCELTYAIEGKYSRFVAVVGIDDAVRPAGNAELVVLGDGKPLGKPVVLTGKDAAKTLRIDVAGVKSLTLRVEFGSDGLDVADHVNLAAARLIKTGK